MSQRLLVCCLNVQEARNSQTIDRIIETCSRVLVQKFIDPLFNRSNLTLCGNSDEIYGAIDKISDVALQEININAAERLVDLTMHHHIGALDLIPVHPILNTSLKDAGELAQRISCLLNTKDIPTLLYGSADVPAYRSLVQIRKQTSFFKRGQCVTADGVPASGHPTMGASVVGATPYVLSYNMVVNTRNVGDVEDAVKALRSREDGVQVMPYKNTWEGKDIVEIACNLTLPQSHTGCKEIMAVGQMLKFVPNIGTMFPSDMALADRLKSCTSQGFSGIEIAFPYTWSISEWEESLRLHPVSVTLINTPLGENREPGLAACHDKQHKFLAGIRKGVEYCKALRCSQLHIMAGNEPHFDGQRQVFLENMKKASELLKGEGIRGLIETISEGTIPGYYLNDVKKTLDLLEEMDSDCIFFQFDVFHLSMLGHSTEQILELFDCNRSKIKHVQVAQPPHRIEISSPGDIDYTAIFNHFLAHAYTDDHIGLEFKMSSYGDSSLTDDLLDFLKRF